MEDLFREVSLEHSRRRERRRLLAAHIRKLRSFQRDCLNKSSAIANANDELLAVQSEIRAKEAQNRRLTTEAEQTQLAILKLLRQKTALEQQVAAYHAVAAEQGDTQQTVALLMRYVAKRRAIDWAQAPLGRFYEERTGRPYPG